MSLCSNDGSLLRNDMVRFWFLGYRDEIKTELQAPVNILKQTFVSAKYDMKIFGPEHKVLVLTASVSSEGSGESEIIGRLARAFAAHIQKVWM